MPELKNQYCLIVFETVVTKMDKNVFNKVVIDHTCFILSEVIWRAKQSFRLNASSANLGKSAKVRIYSFVILQSV